MESETLIQQQSFSKMSKAIDVKRRSEDQSDELSETEKARLLELKNIFEEKKTLTSKEMYEMTVLSHREKLMTNPRYRSALKNFRY